MGKPMHSTQIQHSSHPHLLHLSNLLTQPSTSCAGCDHNISPGHVYTCTPCGFYLHPSCAKFPDLITHPSHPEHALTLLHTPTYPDGFFRCDACGHRGSRFSYHCTFCDFDLHVLCASKPVMANHPTHPHRLHLTFLNPYGEKLGFSCDVCRNIGSSQEWFYRCASCEFDVHLQCTDAEPRLQHRHSFPGTAPVTHRNQVMGVAAAHLLMHSLSTGGVQSYQPLPQHPVYGGVHSYQLPAHGSGVQTYHRPPPQPPAPAGVQRYQPPLQHPTYGGAQTYPPPAQSYQAPASNGVQQYQQPAATANGQSGNGLADAIVTGFVEGAMQQIGQNFMQDLMGGGDGGGGNDGGGDSSLF